MKGTVRGISPRARLTSERSGVSQEQTARLREAGVGRGLEAAEGGISESLLFAGIGVCSGVLEKRSEYTPRGIRVGLAYQTPSEAYDFSRR